MPPLKQITSSKVHPTRRLKAGKWQFAQTVGNPGRLFHKFNGILHEFWAGEPLFVDGSNRMRKGTIIHVDEVRALGSAGLKIFDDSGVGGMHVQDSGQIMFFDQNGNEALGIDAGVASAVNYLTIENSATTDPVHIQAIGGDANIGIRLHTKGTGPLSVKLATTGVLSYTSGAFAFQQATSISTPVNTDLTLSNSGSGDIIFSPGSNVGIGTATPGGSLEIARGTTHDLLIINQTVPATYNADIKFEDNGSARWVLSTRVTGGDAFWLYNSGLAATAIAVDYATNNVGINTASPGKLLDVAGSAVFGVHNGSDEFFIERFSDVFPFAHIIAGSADNNVGVGLKLECRDSDGVQFNAVTILDSGELGINEAAPDEKLEVNGNVHITGDTYWTGDGSGVPYGAMSQENVPTTVTIDTAGTAEIVDGMTGGETNLVTFQNNQELKVTKAGRYLITWALSFNMVSGSGQEVEGSIGKGGAAQSVGSAHRKIGSANDTGAMCGNGILDLAADDLITIMVTNESSTVDVVIAHATLTLMMTGGT